MVERTIGITVAYRKWHIVKSNENPQRIVSYCGKVLTTTFIPTHINKEKLCKACERRVQ